MEASDFTPYVQAMKHLAETANLGNLPDSLSRYATMKVLRDEMLELASQISEDDRSESHKQGLNKLNLAISIFREAALSGLDSNRSPKTRIRSVTENLDKFLSNLSR